MTGIQWTDEVWNPVVGCSKVSEGCRNCYAMVMARRVAAAADAKGGEQTERQRAYQRVVMRRGGDVNDPATGTPLAQWNNRVVCLEEALAEPLKWRRPRRVFVNSMSDLFHPDVPQHFIHEVLHVIKSCPQHTFQILTKRPERAASFEWTCAKYGEDYRGLGNLWLGTSVESQEHLTRAWELLKCPAAVRFLSCEPLLGPLDLDKLELLCKDWRRGATIGTYLDWVIVGGESGPGARPCDVAWIRSIVRQCADSGVACFVKQLGARPYRVMDRLDDPLVGVKSYMKLASSKGGDPAEWPEDLRVRQWPGGGGVKS